MTLPMDSSSLENESTSASGAIDTAIVCFSIVAALLGASLLLLQTDAVARRIFSPLRLRAKRRQEQLHTLQLNIGDVIQGIRTHVNEGQVFEAEIERKITQFVQKGDYVALDDLMNDILEGDGAGDTSSSIVPLIVGIAKDLTVCSTNKCSSTGGMKTNDSDEWYIHLAFPQADGAKQLDGISPRYNRRVQVPLLPFCARLEQKIRENENVKKGSEDHEGKNTSLCFIADASSSAASRALGDILVQTKLIEACKNKTCNIDGIYDNEGSMSRHAIVQEPAWMYVLALLLRKKFITRSEGDTVLYALVKLEMQKFASSSKTIVITLPGQGCTALLMPMLVKLFPDERHVFAYSDHISTVVARGVALVQQKENKIYSFSNMPLPITAIPRMVSVATPIVPMSAKRYKKLAQYLAELPYNIAGVIEAWMSSMDALILLKENENNQYYPFVCNIDRLLKWGVASDNDDCNHLSQLLHYITGSDKTSQSSQLVDAAQSILKDFTQSETKANFSAAFDAKTLAAIDSCASCLKMASLEN